MYKPRFLTHFCFNTAHKPHCFQLIFNTFLFTNLVLFFFSCYKLLFNTTFLCIKLFFNNLLFITFPYTNFIDSNLSLITFCVQTLFFYSILLNTFQCMNLFFFFNNLLLNTFVYTNFFFFFLYSLLFNTFLYTNLVVSNNAKTTFNRVTRLEIISVHKEYIMGGSADETVAIKTGLTTLFLS